MYQLTFQKNVTRLPDWLAGLMDKTGYLVERATGRDPNALCPRGWQLVDAMTGAVLAVNRSIAFDTESCYEAMDWAVDLVAALDMPRIAEWMDRVTPDNHFHFYGLTSHIEHSDQHTFPTWAPSADAFTWLTYP